MNKYYSITRDYGPVELLEKGSRFIAFGFPVSSLSEVKKRIDRIRKQFHDASHYCFAYRLINPGTDDSEDNTLYRFSDDGEPGGTAGQPIYQEILRKDFYNILVIVVRYFGGTKLGTGRLSRAYASSARRLIDLAEKKIFLLREMILVFFPFELTGDMRQLIKRLSIDVDSQDFSPEGTKMRLLVQKGNVDEFIRCINEIGRGRVKFQMDRLKKIAGKTINLKATENS